MVFPVYPATPHLATSQELTAISVVYLQSVTKVKK